MICVCHLQIIPSDVILLRENEIFFSHHAPENKSKTIKTRYQIYSISKSSIITFFIIYIFRC